MSEKQIPNEKTLLDNLGVISYTLDRAYLSRLETDYGVLPFDQNYNKDDQITYAANIRALRIKRCVFDKEEKVSDCFKNVLALFANSNDTIALLVKRFPDSVEFYFVVKNTGIGRNEESKNNIHLLADAIRGNFPGTEVEVVEEKNNGIDTEKLLDFDKNGAVTTLSNVPSEKSEDYLCQGIEKLINGVVPANDSESYSIVFLMEAIPMEEVCNILSGYEELATAIAPFASYQFQVGSNKTETRGEMESTTHTDGISRSVSKTHSVNIGANRGSFSSNSFSLSAGVTLKGIVNLAANFTHTVGKSIGSSMGYGYSWGTTSTDSHSDSNMAGTNHSVSIGESHNTTYTYKSYLVNDIITKLEASIKRIEESKSTGLWKYATYVFSSEVSTTKNVANFLRALSQGDQSYVDSTFMQSWRYEKSNSITPYGEIVKYVSHFCHPVFGNLVDGTPVTPAINVSTTELSNLVAFPKHSVQNLPVIECVRFGREAYGLSPLEKDVSIGCSYHMHQCPHPDKRCEVNGTLKCVGCSNQKSQNTPSRIFISKRDFTKHAFITGSTGSGKSNTVYTLIDKMCLADDHDKTKFLIIEPAKGEYKDIFGGRDDVSTYGTNPLVAPNLLQINPFSFPYGIHVLEHIDRLVEIFNSCWPMYAAMPAILREAVEKAYEYVGWNLRQSKFPGQFPTFDTLLKTLPEVIDSSAYSSDTSNDYKGALITRIRSLTRGIQGLLFNDDTPAERLFNQNSIVDLSRIGSSETKALIMGVLILKLQEFRTAEGIHNSKKLRHITVLEEAHNLLRRTSSEQYQESSNLQGKSVEMLANVIAEMRTFGEGFIIVDQSPGLLDMSVIRNTNTKIILRLPDEEDRQLVGRAAGLSELQIPELARLETGVAAVSQSDWLEPVLCKIDEYEDSVSLKSRFEKDKERKCTNGIFNWWKDDENDAVCQFLSEVFKPYDLERKKLSGDIADKVRAWFDSIRINDTVRSCVERILNGQKVVAAQQLIIASAICGDRIRHLSNRENVISEVTKTLIGQYCFSENDPVIHYINDLFLTNFPDNIYTVDPENVEGLKNGVR